jgi:hypothetical protein
MIFFKKLRDKKESLDKTIFKKIINILKNNKPHTDIKKIQVQRQICLLD